MSGFFFSALLAAGVAFVIALIAYFAGQARGRRHPIRAARVIEQPDAGAHYRAGYLAGHLAGWKDAEAHHGWIAPSQNPPRVDFPSVRFPQSGQPAAIPPVRRPSEMPPQAVMPPAKPQPQPLVASVPAPSPAERLAEAAARKAKRDRQNINITLYVASLLLVAAAALFVGTSLPPAFRLMGVWGVTAVFYCAGFVLHARVQRLRPAAVAFAGTGLALIPVAGIAMYSFALHNGPAAWLVTSLVGTLAYVMAALRLESKVLAYLSLSFVVSTTWSGIAVLGGALVWYFSALIAVAALLTLASLAQPRWLPPVFMQPLMSLHPFAVPAVCVTATLVVQFLERWEYAILMAVACLYFAAVAALPREKYRLLQLYGARVTAILAVLAAVSDAGGTAEQVLLALILLLGAQSLLVAWQSMRLRRWFHREGGRGAVRHWRTDALVCFSLEAATAVLLAYAPASGISQLPIWTGFQAVLITAMLLAWRQGREAEFTVLAALLVAAPFTRELDGWGAAALLCMAAGYWFIRSLQRRQPLRFHFILAARGALTLAVPAVVAALLIDEPESGAGVWAALVIAASAQLLLTAALQRLHMTVLWADASQIGFAATSLLALAGVLLVERSYGQPLATLALAVALFFAIASGWLAFPYPAARAAQSPYPVSSSSRAWRASVPELVAPATVAWTAILAFGSISLRFGNAVLLAGAVYFGVQAVRLKTPLHRQAYWWITQAIATVLAGTGYSQLLQQDTVIRIAGEEPHVSLVVMLALAAQLVACIVRAARGRYPGRVAVEAAVLLSLMTGAAAVAHVFAPLSGKAPDAGWQPGFSAILLAASAVAAAYFLRADRLAPLFAPVAFVVAMILGGSRLRVAELLLAIFAVFAAAMVPVSARTKAKGAYFLAARVLTAALVVLLAQDATASVTLVSLTLAVVLMVQHLIHWVTRNRLTDIAFRQATIWATLVAQLLLPVSYVLQRDYFGGGRWVVIVELVLLLLSTAAAHYVFALRGSSYLVIPAAIGAVAVAGPWFVFPASTWLSRPLLGEDGMAFALLALASPAVGIRLAGRTRANDGVQRWFWLVAAFGFTASAVVFAWEAAIAVAGMGLLVLAVVLFLASHLEGPALLYPPAAAAWLIGATVAAEGVVNNGPYPLSGFLPWLLGCGGGAAALYTLRHLPVAGIRVNPVRRITLVAGACAGLAAAAVSGLLHDDTALAGAALLIVAAVLACYETPAGRRPLAAELAAIPVVIALQRSLLFVEGSSPESFWVLQWWVVLGAVMAGVRYVSSGTQTGRVRLMVTGGLLSAGAVMVIFTGTVPQQLWILVGFALLLAAGLVLEDRLFVWWGAVGVGMSVLWALRSYAFAVLAFLALVLIALAVWRLNRTKPQVEVGPAMRESGPEGRRERSSS